MKKGTGKKRDRVRAAIFGGTFNPVHLGHLNIARDIKKRFALDHVFVVPSAVPPHKKMANIADAKQRMEMLHLCFDSLEGFSVSDAELMRSGPSYTIDTVKEFLRLLPAGSELFLIMGMDAFLEIDTWKSWRELLKLVPLIVMTRPGTCSPREKELLLAEKYLKNKLSPHYHYSEKEACFTHDTRNSIYISEVIPVDISSTDIRDLIKKKKPVTGLVHHKVAEYIHSKGLYL